MGAPGRWEAVLFSLPSAFQARVVAQGRSEQHNRTTPTKQRRAGAILFFAVSDQGDPGDWQRNRAIDLVSLPLDECSCAVFATASQAANVNDGGQSRRHFTLSRSERRWRDATAIVCKSGAEAPNRQTHRWGLQLTSPPHPYAVVGVSARGSGPSRSWVARSRAELIVKLPLTSMPPPGTPSG